MAEEQTEDQYAALDTSDSQTPMWLVRTPPKLAAAWCNAPEGTVLGTLTFTRGTAPNANPIIKQSLKLSVSSDEFASSYPELPLDYSIEAMTKKVPVLHPFSRAHDGSTALHGQISRTCNLQICQSNKYKAYCKTRLLKNVTSNRVVKSVETVDLAVGKGNLHPTGSEGFGDSIMKHGKSVLEMNELRSNENISGNKRKIYEGQSTRSIVFELFEQQRFWTVKELRTVSGRLEKELRPVLSELCEFHRSGEQKGTWELKKEFQMS